MGFAGRTPGEGSAMPERSESPAEQAVPLSVRITSLEMDGNTRAFANAEYGGLTISRIRVKQDEYGALSVAMPKFRQTGGGWKDVCSFNTAEARNRLTGAVLDAYERQTAQIQGRTQTAVGTQEPERIAGREEAPDLGGPEQDRDGPVMGMSM
jgi:DNA-binding cell septation regulator SpoVG